MGELMEDQFEMPWPTSLNATYRSLAFISKKTGKPMARPILSAQGREYIELSQKVLAQQQPKGFRDKRIKIEITFYPPDRRKRDLGNLDKVLIDCLEKYGIFDNDHQIDHQTFIRGGICKGKKGHVVIKIKEMEVENLPCPCGICAESESGEGLFSKISV